MVDDSALAPEEDFRIQRRNLVALCIVIFIVHSKAFVIETITTPVASLKISDIAYIRGFLFCSLIYITIRFIHSLARTNAWKHLESHIQVRMAKRIKHPKALITILEAYRPTDPNPATVYTYGDQRAPVRYTLTTFTGNSFDPIIKITQINRLERDGSDNLSEFDDYLRKENRWGVWRSAFYSINWPTVTFFYPLFFAFFATLELLSMPLINSAFKEAGAFLIKIEGFVISFFPLSFWPFS